MLRKKEVNLPRLSQNTSSAGAWDDKVHAVVTSRLRPTPHSPFREWLARPHSHCEKVPCINHKCMQCNYTLRWTSAYKVVPALTDLLKLTAKYTFLCGPNGNRRMRIKRTFYLWWIMRLHVHETLIILDKSFTIMFLSEQIYTLWSLILHKQQLPSKK